MSGSAAYLPVVRQQHFASVGGLRVDPANQEVQLVSAGTATTDSEVLLLAYLLPRTAGWWFGATGTPGLLWGAPGGGCLRPVQHVRKLLLRGEPAAHDLTSPKADSVVNMPTPTLTATAVPAAALKA